MIFSRMVSLPSRAFQDINLSLILESLHPYFPSIVENVTVSYGRKAVLKCEVENLRNYKVTGIIDNMDGL